MRLLMLILLILGFIVLTKLNEVKTWNIYVLLSFFVVFEIASIIAHPFLGIITVICALIALCKILYESNGKGINIPYIFFMISMIIFSFGFLLQVIEIFTGRLF